MKASGLSASSYQLWDWCQWKFYLQSLGFEDVSGPSAIMGHLGHKVLEVLSKASIIKHDRNSKIFNPEYLWEICFNHYFMQSPNVAKDIQPAKLAAIARGVRDLINSDYTPVRDNTIGAEISFHIPLKGKEYIIGKNKDGTDRYFAIRGFIDRVDKIDDETIEIIDYKTGTRADFSSKDRKKKGPEELHKDIQPKLYHYAAKHLYPWAKNIIITFIYIVDGGPVSVPFCDSDLKETQELISRRFKAIQAENDPQRNLTWKCKSMCPFYKDNTCDTVWEEKNELGLKFVQEKYTILNVRKRMRR